MQQYYTAIEIENGRYIGIVHNSGNNSVVYRTKPYLSQIQAIMDITEHLKTKKPNTTSQSNTISNTVQYQPAPQAGRRCCGR